MHDAWFFVGIFAFIFLVWIAIGGPTHPIAFSGPVLTNAGAQGGGSGFTFPHASFGIGASYISLPGSSNSTIPLVSGGGSIGGSTNTSIPDLSGVSFGTPSPYRGLVTMSHYVSGAGSANPANETITISVAQGASVPVDLSGWTLQSEATGNAEVIPKGTQVPSSGTVNAVQDIVLLPGNSAYVISGRSPIGASFEENKCIGYFGNYQSFYPSLPLTCPAPSQELMAYSGATYIRDNSCIQYVNSISRCAAVLTPPPTLSGSCQSFLVKYLNYNGCVAAHQSDSDFNGSVWHIYLGRTTPLWRSSNEVVKLLDASGKTVDAFSY